VAAAFEELLLEDVATSSFILATIAETMDDF
jgi:hypothetical protein